MIRTEVDLTYGLDANGKLQHIDDVPGGNSCGCVCPHCKAQLCAKKGNRRVHHFAHVSGSDCGHGYESALHLMAKEILEEGKCVMLPPCGGNDERKVINFERVHVENRDDELHLIPDCIGYAKQAEVWIEFKNTHAVPPKKITKIVSDKINCIEIDISECLLDRGILKRYIEKSQKNRRWIYCGADIVDGYLPNSDLIYDALINAIDRQLSDDWKSIIERHLAIDESNHIVNLTDIDDVTELDMIENPCHCVYCGEPLYLDIDSKGGYMFVHQTDSPGCTGKRYLSAVLKRILKYC